MATTSAFSLLLFLTLLLIAATASARPCKTLFYFSAATTTTTFYPSNFPNPNPIIRTHKPHFFTLIFTTTTTTTTARFPNYSFNFDPNYPSTENSQLSSPAMTDLPLKFYSSSILDRTRDIMSVVGALLFGVGCGALTAASIYFVWAVFSHRRLDFDDISSSDDDEEDDDIAVAKKLGYVAIPTEAKVVGDDGDRKRAAKEVV